MNQGIHAEQTQTPTPVALWQPTTASAQTGSHGSCVLSGLGTIREMLSSIDSVTLAGQRYTMSKIIAFFEELGANVYVGVSERSQVLIARLLNQLGHESARPLPDAPRFTQHATDVLALLDELV